jgi:hypothetical protein
LARLSTAESPEVGARLITPDGQVLDLSEADWRALSGAVVRLFSLSELEERQKNPKALTPAQPTNAGLPWNSDLDLRLVTLWQEGRDLRAIATQLGRSRGSIAARLVRLGLVESRRDARNGANVPDNEAHEVDAGTDR